MEVKRTPEESPMQEFDNEKRIWLKVDDIDNNLYDQHFTPTQFNTDMNILSTEQYVPAFLKKYCVESTGLLI